MLITLLKESGVIGTSSKIYKLKSGYNKNLLLNSAVNKSKQNSSIIIPKTMKILPAPYWILKRHKPSIGNRFTIASKQCIIKRLSVKAGIENQVI